MSYIDMANDLNNFIQNLFLQSPIKPTEIAVMGHSMGGKAAMALALLHVCLLSKLN
jgi:pimeloyl-ACP methyl ester carboxylesterase